jgi:hypothetical protein
MSQQRHSEALNLRVSPGIRSRLDAQAERYDQTITSVSRIALVIGLEALERLQGETLTVPDDPGPTG